LRLKKLNRSKEICGSGSWQSSSIARIALAGISGIGPSRQQHCDHLELKTAADVDLRSISQFQASDGLYV